MLLAVDTGQRAGPNDPGDKDRDLKMLLHQLCHLQAKQRKLERELQRYKPFADYLRKVLERIPKGCSDAEKPEAAGLEALVRRYGKLLTASREAQKQLDAFCQMTRAAHEALESLEDSRKALLPSLKIRLCQLQKKCHHKQEQWRQVQAGMAHQNSPGFDTHAHPGGHNGRLLSYMQVAIHNMAQQCCPPAHGIPTGMGLFSQLDLIQAFILDKMETVRMISLLTEPRVCWAGDSLRDKSLRKHPRPFRKWPMNQATSPRTPFPSGQASECSSLS
ncbi:PREDICTED: uncharacterized protein LOC102009989 isoform X2 [Chinchilla lanigera]|uniref:Coiled-coil domain containing 197 n=1 Tax=Chinchilla lanigera TaxID=34839 RepID=A0A8C2VYF9_CHILA|nr:PREDICTED: uncharacterized protein LOC102009989 isoform X2 [Chinchilla lanigera]